ncbi:hypothetical protein [Clostridium butyricum]
MLTHVGTGIIETERLILRKFEYADYENMLKYWISDPEIQSLYGDRFIVQRKKLENYLINI